jgi:hypothetical protein
MGFGSGRRFAKIASMTLFVAGVLVPAAGCGSAWCSMCPPEEDSSGAWGGAAGVSSGGTTSTTPCPTSPLSDGSDCNEPDRVCTARLADAQILGCTCLLESSTATWSCDVVSCPAPFASPDAECSVYLLGEVCGGEAGRCECRWDPEAWVARWSC